MDGRIVIYVPAVPVAQPRPRATSIGGRARMYESKSDHPIKAFKATVRLAARSEYSGPPLEGPLMVDALFVFPRPKAKRWKSRPMPRYWHTSKPDRDNCDKAILDALKGIMWHDDCQVCDGNIEKYVASGDEQPHVVITVMQLSESNQTKGN